MSKNSEFLLPDITKRKAFRTGGILWMGYDIRTDGLQQNHSVSKKHFKTKPIQNARCERLKNITTENWNFLRTIGTEFDLRINILLELIPKTGIVQFIYNEVIDDRTRILYYCYEGKQEYIPEESGNREKSISVGKRPNDATHIITGIISGIQAVIVLQLLPDNAKVHQIDSVLDKFCDNLSRDYLDFEFTAQERSILKMIENTRVYSNIQNLSNVQKFTDILKHIKEIKHEVQQYAPVTFCLQTINLLKTETNQRYLTLDTLPPPLQDKLEDILLKLVSKRNTLKLAFSSQNLDKFDRYVSSNVLTMKQEWRNLSKKYDIDIQRLKQLIADFHQGKIKNNKISELLDEIGQTQLIRKLHGLNKNVYNMISKLNFFNRMREIKFEYCTYIERNIVKADVPNNLKYKIFHETKCEFAICSNDDLNKMMPDKLDEMISELCMKHKANPNLRIIYVDFSEFTERFNDMLLLHNKKGTLEDKSIASNRISNKSSSLSKSPTSSITISQDERSTTSQQTKNVDDTINILLLGETGVGKSTFINAFANYLTYDSLEQAQSNDPIVVLTVSFLMTTGDQFEDHIMDFVDPHRTNNEDFDHPGQSVTQKCRSYVFPIRHGNGNRLRIIDTPGFGDTRGIEQDEINMEHILKYINCFTHLNAICFLLKPNSSRLNMSFRSCLLQLFDFLDINARQNIIFCFTNSRSTFYRLGDTGPLLKSFFKSFSVQDIPLNPSNSFFFDSESFRYLVAVKHGISFNDELKHEYEMSWSISMKESNRLIEYIIKNLNIYRIQGQLQSIKHAQLQILYLVRPILETIRNMHRNLILMENKIENRFFEIFAKPLDNLLAFCHKCPIKILTLDVFLVKLYCTHRMKDECLDCDCSEDQHTVIDYTLEYKLTMNSLNSHEQNNMINQLKILLEAMVHFDYFLKQISYSNIHKSFSFLLNQIIADEYSLSTSDSRKYLNNQLAKNLENLRQSYEQMMDLLITKRHQFDLSRIYELIHHINEYPMVKRQMIAVNRTQLNMMEKYEYEVVNRTSFN